jgi:hypothetical protein
MEHDCAHSVADRRPCSLQCGMVTATVVTRLCRNSPLRPFAVRSPSVIQDNERRRRRAVVSFKGAHFPKEIILTAIPYHCRVIEAFGGVTISSAEQETMRHSYRPDIPPTPQSYRTQVLARLYPFLRREKFLCRNVLIIKKIEFLNVAFCPRRSKNFRCQSQPKSVVDDARYPNG